MFRNLLRIITGERSTVTPGEQAQTAAKEQKVVKVKFAHDINALKDAGYKIQGGEVITLSLKDALEIMPRDRKRVDAYKTLTDYLSKDFGVTLIITSQKTAKNVESSNKNNKPL